MHFGSQAGAQSSDLSLLVTRRDQKPWKQIPIDHQQVKKLDSKGGSARSTLFSLPVSSLLLSAAIDSTSFSSNRVVVSCGISWCWQFNNTSRSRQEDSQVPRPHQI